MKSGRCLNENVLEWAYKKRLIGQPPKKLPTYKKEMEKPRTPPVTPSENAGQRLRTRRPDKQLYVPRGRRSDASSGDETTQSNEKLHLGSSTTEVSDKKLQNSPNAVENSKSVQETPRRRRRTSEVLVNRMLRKDLPKNLPDVVPVERKKMCDKESRSVNQNYHGEINIVRKSSLGENSQVNCVRKSSASDREPCDLVQVTSDGNRCTVMPTKNAPICEKNVQKSSLSNLSLAAHARKSSLSDTSTTKPSLRTKESLENVSSFRNTVTGSSKSTIVGKNVQKPLVSIRVGDKSLVERTRKLRLNACTQAASKCAVEQTTGNRRKSNDSGTSVENVAKTMDFCERINFRITPAPLKPSDGNNTHSRNCDGAREFELVSVSAEDTGLGNSRFTSEREHLETVDIQKLILSTENMEINNGESTPSDLLDEVYVDAEESIDHMYLIHEIKSNLFESEIDPESTICSKSGDDDYAQSLKDIILSEVHAPVIETNANADVINSQSSDCGKSSTCIIGDVESLQNTEEGYKTIDEAIVKKSCHSSRTIADRFRDHVDNLLPVLVPVQHPSIENYSMILPQETSLQENVVHELSLMEVNTESSGSQSLGTLQTTLENEISVSVEKDTNLSTVHNEHVESSFVIEPAMPQELEESSRSNTEDIQELDDSLESAIPAGQHLDEEFLRLDECLDQTHEDSWDSLFDENGDCLNPTVVTELTDTLGKVDIQISKYDYLDFRPQDPDLSSEEFSHIVELYDFPAEFKTQDLMSTLSTFRERGFNIKWIDDTHALAVFSSPIAATEALSIQHPLVKVRPLSQAISGSKWKAKRFSEDLLPYKPRPQTTASLARRLVSGALGLKVSISKEQRDQERQRLQQAKERKRHVAKQKQDVWDGAVK